MQISPIGFDPSQSAMGGASHPWLSAGTGVGAAPPDMLAGGLASPDMLAGGGSAANAAAMAALGAADLNLAGAALTGAEAHGMKNGAQQQQIASNPNIHTGLLPGLADTYSF